MFLFVLVLIDYKWRGGVAYQIFIFNLSIVFPLIIIFSLILLLRKSNSYELILKRFILYNLFIYLIFIFIGYVYGMLYSN